MALFVSFAGTGVRAEVVAVTTDRTIGVPVRVTTDLREADCVVVFGQPSRAEKFVYLENDPGAKDVKRIMVSKRGDSDPSGCL
jgi:hypothetical protein